MASAKTALPNWIERPARRPLWLLLGAVLLLGNGRWSVVADQLELSDGRHWEGAFSGVMTRGKVSFSRYDHPEVWQGGGGEIVRLDLDAPLPGTLTRARSPRQKVPVQVVGFRQGALVVRLDGRRQTVSVPLSQIQTLSVVMDMQAFMREKERRRSAQVRSPRSDAVENRLVPGKAAIVHFCLPDIQASSRQGALARSLCERSRGRAVYVEVVLDGLESPLARRYELRSLPQFWFYDVRGKVRRQLSERFTEADLEQAMAQTLK